MTTYLKSYNDDIHTSSISWLKRYMYIHIPSIIEIWWKQIELLSGQQRVMGKNQLGNAYKIEEKMEILENLELIMCLWLMYPKFEIISFPKPIKHTLEDYSTKIHLLD